MYQPLVIKGINIQNDTITEKESLVAPVHHAENYTQTAFTIMPRKTQEALF
jgi:hypothetical protein